MHSQILSPTQHLSRFYTSRLPSTRTSNFVSQLVSKKWHETHKTMKTGPIIHCKMLGLQFFIICTYKNTCMFHHTIQLWDDRTWNFGHESLYWSNICGFQLQRSNMYMSSLFYSIAQICYKNNLVNNVCSKSVDHLHSFTAQNRISPKKYQTVQC